MTRSAAGVLIGVAVLGAVGLAGLSAARLVVPSGLGGDNPTSVIFMVVGIGLLAESIAGYVTARIAPSHPYLHAVGVAALLSLIVLAFGAVSTEPFGVAAGQAGLNLLQIPGLVFGSFVAVRLRRENQVAKTEQEE